MKHCALLLVFAAFFAGCSSPEEETVDIMNEIADILATVKDKESAEAVAPKLEKLGARGKELQKEIKEKEVPEEMKKEAISAAKRIQKEMMRIMGIPGAMEVLSKIDMG